MEGITFPPVDWDANEDEQVLTAHALDVEVWDWTVGAEPVQLQRHIICDNEVGLRPPEPERGYWGYEDGPECAPGSNECDGDWQWASCVAYDPNCNPNAGRCYSPKNRYLTIDPTVNADPVAYHITLSEIDSDNPDGNRYDDSCLLLEGFLSNPVCLTDGGAPVQPQPASTDPCQGPGLFGWVSYVVEGAVTPRVWSEYPLLVTGCECVPAATYEFCASADGLDPLDQIPVVIPTAHNPPGQTQKWGDVTGGPGAVLPWTPPEYAMNFNDISACIAAFQGTGPRLEWCEMRIDHDVNFDDVQMLLWAFRGDRYPEVPDFCSGGPEERPLIGHEPCDCADACP